MLGSIQGFVIKKDNKPFKKYFLELKALKRSPSIPLKKGEEFNSPPFLRGAGGDLRQFLKRIINSNLNFLVVV
jgi:hypothetical protein